MSSGIEFEEIYCDTDNCKNLPEYCDHCKFLLVEELCLEEDYLRLHYGKCTIIGKIRKSANDHVLLENIRITNFPTEYSLPEGTISIRLLTFSYFGTELKENNYVEITGEVVLYHTEKHGYNHKSFLTSRGIAEQIALVKGNEEKLNLLKYYQEHYKPAIKVWYVQPISRAGDLIQRNLELRMLQEQI